MQPERSAEGLAGSGGRRGRSARNPGPPHSAQAASSTPSPASAPARLPTRCRAHSLPAGRALRPGRRVCVCARRTEGHCAVLSPFPSLPGSLSHTRTSKAAFTIWDEKRRRRLGLKSLAPKRNKNKPLESAGVSGRCHARTLLRACLSVSTTVSTTQPPTGRVLSGGLRCSRLHGAENGGNRSPGSQKRTQ